MIHFSLFFGIGGFELAAEWMGWKNYLSCEINPVCNHVRKYYWPESYHHENIKDLNYETINIELSRRFGNDWRNDEIIITGGFPCQPFSTAGKRKGTEDDRYLWGEMLRVIREVSPDYILGENVSGLVNWSKGMVFEEVQATLEAEGYEILPVLLPAAGINAPHKRERIFFIAYSNHARFGQSHKKNEGRPSKQSDSLCFQLYDSNTYSIGLQRIGTDRNVNKKEPLQAGKQINNSICTAWEKFPSESPVYSGNDGISFQLDGITVSKWRKESIHAYGNAVVPPLIYQIFQVIQEFTLIYQK
jgi:DNA (cytosine-5)-methyltransferase 1